MWLSPGTHYGCLHFSVPVHEERLLLCICQTNASCSAEMLAVLIDEPRGQPWMVTVCWGAGRAQRCWEAGRPPCSAALRRLPVACASRSRAWAYPPRWRPLPARNGHVGSPSSQSSAPFCLHCDCSHSGHAAQLGIAAHPGGQRPCPACSLSHRHHQHHSLPHTQGASSCPAWPPPAASPRRRPAWGAWTTPSPTPPAWPCRTP